MPPETLSVPETAHYCRGCGQAYQRDFPEIIDEEVCPACRRKLPPSLLKACGDPFDYALRLRTGEIVFFESAQLHGDFVTLTVLRDHEYGMADQIPQGTKLLIPAERGLDVRVADIVWCADAPFGS